MKFAIFESLKSKAGKLTQDIFALYLAARDPRTPWYAKAVAALIVAYALSPIDLIPDFIPILGYIDDLLLLPLGIWLVLKMVPPEVLAECRTKAAANKGKPPRNWWIAAAIVILWLLAAILLGRYLLRNFVETDNWSDRIGY
jgi:uncharacterized membrane protein YkvA (DUF1232 family)